MDFHCAHCGGPRLGMDSVFRCHEIIHDAYSSLVNALAVPVLMLNEHWQVVYANKAFMALAKLPESAGILGLRIGEILGCANAEKSLSGCGTSRHCPACGFFRAFYACEDRGTPMRFSESGSGQGGGALDGSVGICRQARLEDYDLRVCTVIPSIWL